MIRFVVNDIVNVIVVNAIVNDDVVSATTDQINYLTQEGIGYDMYLNICCSFHE